ncbi:MAG: hypothetical protein KGI25_03735 [Thaumarchaeota archaeon]|nr:hypothetical protein [Nitrososphaerota archaeon]
MQSWHNLDTHGRRLNRIIRILEKKIRHTTEDDKAVKYANSIAFLTRELVSIAKVYHGIEDVLKKTEEIQR